MRKVLIVSDFACTTGFSSVMTNLLTRMDLSAWVPHIIALNYHGDPHPLRTQFPHIYPASISGRHDSYGVMRFPDILDAVEPALVVMQNDAWNIPLMFKQAKAKGVKMPPSIAYCPPDSPGQPGAALTAHGLTHLVCPTQFGIDELVDGGYDGPATVLPYGVDPIFQPMDRTLARKTLSFPDNMLDAFLVGRADRNAVRKRYDLTLEGFAEWYHGSGRPQDAYLYLHCSIDSPHGWPLIDLAKYYGIAPRLKFTGQHVEGSGIPLDRMPLIYNAWDLHLSPAPEGFGLVGLESARCGIAQAVLNYSAYGEWLGEAAHLLPVTHRYATPVVNTIQASTSPVAIAEAIQQVYEDRGYRDRLGAKALAVASQPCYDWQVSADRFLALWNEVAG